jgi:peptidyl-prolyl cis-trans isomerase B (cyclophilin B)
VSLIVERGSPPPPPKEKLVSVNGKFATVTDPPPPGPNGTAFTVTVASGADELSEVAEILDRTNVVVGEVVEGMEVLDAIAALPTVKDNSSSPFFAVAKTIGDKRATVAEQAFGKPFAKVTVSKSGVVEDAPPVEAAVGVESAEVASS